MNYTASFSDRTVAQALPDVRAEFIRKVYNLFFLSMIVTVGVGVGCATVAPAMIGMLMPLMIGGLVVGLIMSFTRSIPGVNLGMLILYSAIQGAILGPLLTLLNRVAPGIPLQAAVMTVAVFGGLSLYAMQSKKDFSYLGGMLCIAAVALLIGGIVMMFVQSSLLSMLYASAGILIFGGFVLYDTSQIIHKLTPDEAVGGAISLYLDFIGLFYMILRLLMELNRSRN